MDPTAYKATVTAAFNDAAASYDQLGVEFFTPLGRRLVEIARPGPGERVLDIGCGRGAALFPAAELVGPSGSVLGIDIAPAMVDQVREQAARQGATNIDARVLDGEAPDLPARSLDLITGSHSVIFLPDPRAALARYAKLLDDNGRIAFTSPVFTAGTFPFMPPVFADLIPLSLLGYLPAEWQPEQLRIRFNSWLDNVEDLRATMTKAGFTGLEVVDEPVVLVADSGTTWVDWSHTHGMRLLWHYLPQDQSALLRERLITSLDSMRDGGPLRIDVPVRYVTARVAR
jgi:O-methyltransferase / aklanonic acid methyltransferase